MSTETTSAVPRESLTLVEHGLFPIRIHANLTPPALIEHALRRSEGQLTDHGAFTAVTTPHTGRSPKDKFVVEEPGTADRIWWEKNERMEAEAFERLHRRRAGAISTPASCSCRTCSAAPIRPTALLGPLHHAERVARAVRAEHVHPPRRRPSWRGSSPTSPCCTRPSSRPTRRATAPAPAPSSCSTSRKKLVLIGGTRYAGEMKKSHLHRAELPAAAAGRAADALLGQRRPGGRHRALLRPLGHRQDDALRRSGARLIGDDEHGWSDRGVFNFEGGCYAKVIRLRSEDRAGDLRRDPDVRHRPRERGARPGDPGGGLRRRPDHREHPRLLPAPLHPEPRARAARGGHPRNIVFLTADAFGVLPPIARLTAEQAMYHFLSGYTAKVAGTERGRHRAAGHVLAPASARRSCRCIPACTPRCWASGSPSHGAQVWLVNTGWTGGAVRHRAADEAGPHPRDGARGALRRARPGAVTRSDPVFGSRCPTAVPDVPAEVLTPATPGPTRRPTTRRRTSWRRCSGRTSSSSRRRCPGAVADGGPERT